MNHVAIFFVPVNATQPDLEAALHEHLASLPSGETAQQSKPGRAAITDNDQWPLWTWFVPNPYP